MKIRFAIARLMIALAIKIAGTDGVKSAAYSNKDVLFNVELKPDFVVIAKIGLQYFNREN